MSEYSISALEILRNPQATMQWYIIPLLLIVIYIYNRELKDKNYNVVLGGAALWGMDLFNEIWNSIVFYLSGFAPVWGTPNGTGNTALLILIGYNIEISLMFAIMGIATCLILPEDKKMKIAGINNRVFLIVIFTTLSVMVECFLNYCGLLTWEYSLWSTKFPWLVWLIGYAPFFTMAILVHDMEKRKHQFLTLAVIYGVDISLLIIFGSIGWL
ncbi:MAG: hypothetical protein H6680_00390 [Desulfobacteraceae bacterium]|nr:hypothetical protein [Desulfobacteraceae bacterium]